MAFHSNMCKDLSMREISDISLSGFQRKHQLTLNLVQRIGLEAELQGHSGCVNCLEWNSQGTLLASGSDDVHVKIWDPFHHKLLHSVQTGHHGNIFSIKFLPCANDGIIVSGAADHKIRVHDIKASETTQVFSCHAGRVKRLATAPSVPFLFWSAAEDGTIMQFDLRDPDSCSSNQPRNVLVNLKAHMGIQAEAKCLAINPLRTEQLAVGANDPYVRLYDRRMLSCKPIKFPTESAGRSSWERQNLLLTSEDDFSLPHSAVQYYIAGHLPQKQKDYKKRYRTLASTYLTFSPDGSELLVNLGGEQIYLFDINRPSRPKKFDLPMPVKLTNGVIKEAAKVSSNGYNIGRTGTTTNGVTNGISNGITKHIAAASSSHQVDSDEGTRKTKKKKVPTATLR